jgi:hypothetical protein
VIPQGQRVVVKCEAGHIIEGAEVIDLLTPLVGEKRAFLVVDGKVEFTYKAPLQCKKRQVKIYVYDSTTRAPLDIIPFSETKEFDLIGVKTIPLNCPTYSLMEYIDKEHWSDEYNTFDQNIHILLRLDLVPFVHPSMVQLTSVSVIECSGEYNYVHKDETEHLHLVSASPQFFNTILHLVHDSKTGNLIGTLFTPIEADLEWQGDEATYPPPDRVKVGPVTKFEGNDSRKAIAKDADAFQEVNDNPGLDPKTIRQRMDIALSGMLGALAHPDNLVAGGDNKTYYLGGGIWSKKSKNGWYQKEYRWELYINK